MTGVILAIDSGTTAVKATIWSNSLKLIGSASEKISMSYGNQGMAEQDPEEIWNKQRKVIRDVMLKTGTEAGNIASVGITNQRETVIAWDKRDGRPIHQAISWQDRRNSSLVEGFRSDHFSFFKSKTGLIPDTYFSASKIQWLLNNVPGIDALIKENRPGFFRTRDVISVMSSSLKSILIDFLSHSINPPAKKMLPSRQKFLPPDSSV